MSKLTKQEREQRVLEAQAQALQFRRALVTLARGIHKTRDVLLIEAWEFLASFWNASLEKIVALEDDKQRQRRAAADSQRGFTHEQFVQAEPRAQNDKDLARILKVSPSTIARYRATLKRSPSFTEQVIEESRTERMRTNDDLRRALSRAQYELEDAKAEIEVAKTVNADLRQKLRRRKKT